MRRLPLIPFIPFGDVVDPQEEEEEVEENDKMHYIFVNVLVSVSCNELTVVNTYQRGTVVGILLEA